MDNANKWFVGLDSLQKICHFLNIPKIYISMRGTLGIYALEFVRIDRDQEKPLIKIIYDLQRLFLQRK